jgi:hypothetical protein
MARRPHHHRETPTDKVSVKAPLASHVVPLNAEPFRMPRLGDNKPNLPPSNTLHVSPAQDEIGGGNFTADDFWNLQGFTLMRFIARAYDLNPVRIVVPASLNTKKRYDFAFVAPDHAGISRATNDLQLTTAFTRNSKRCSSPHALCRSASRTRSASAPAGLVGHLPYCAGESS